MVSINKLATAQFKKPDIIRRFYQAELNTNLKNRQGWQDGGLCPFHADNQPGSFRINLSTGAFKCFACGASGGDVIAFVMALHGLTFPDALAKLADDGGLA